jgi:hypothetical protein
MTERRAEIPLPAGYYDWLEGLVQSNVQYDAVKRDGVIEVFTANLGDGYEVDIKICNGDTGPWIDPVLFHHGCEMACGDVGESLGATYEFEHEDGDHNQWKFIVSLKRMEE